MVRFHVGAPNSLNFDSEFCTYFSLIGALIREVSNRASTYADPKSNIATYSGCGAHPKIPHNFCS